ncbi:hypothetical protein A2U01_0065122, partial [Trifolium medium]|nr:hypothetical protein [Trifolium medium]
MPHKDGEECAKVTMSAAPSGAYIVNEDIMGGTRCAADVRVGDVVLKLGKHFEQEGRKEVIKQGDRLQSSGVVGVTKDPECKVLVRNYRTLADDV